MSGVRERGGAVVNPHPKIRKTVKWAGAAVTVLLVVVWIGSGWQRLGWQSPPFDCGLARGALQVCVWEPQSRRDAFLWLTGPIEFRWLWQRWWIAREDRAPFGVMYILPLWIPTAAALGITAAASRLDTLARRRARVGLCPKCNYDRTGLAAGSVCPECGSGGVPS